MFKIEKIPKKQKRGWTVLLDDEEMPPIGKIEIRSQFGTLFYGLRPEGYDGWAFREVGGGGAVTLPYTYDEEGNLFVGLLIEDRPNMGEKPVLCAIGGFVEKDESQNKAQIRESEEEAGLDTKKAKMLKGVKTNANRAFFIADANANEGMAMYAIELPFDWLDKKECEDGVSGKKLTQGFNKFKKVEEVRFFPWREAIRLSPDALAHSAIAKLLATVL